VLENLLTSPTAFYIAFFAMAAISGLVFDGVFRAIYKAVDAKRSWTIRLDEDAGTAEVKRRLVADGKFIVKGSGSDPDKEYPVSGRSRYASNGNGTYIVDRQKGFHYTGWTSKQIQDHLASMGDTKMGARLRVLNPELLFEHGKTSVKQRWLSGKREKKSLMEALALPAMIVAIAAIAVLGFVVYKFAPVG
jgi:hypothetical protein